MPEQITEKQRVREQYNTFVGYNSGSTTHAMGTWGDNNVVIGCNAPLGGSVSNKLVIDSYMSPQRHDLVTPFIYGDFVAKVLNFDAVLTVRRTPLADETYTKVAVMNAGNTIGYKNIADFGFLPLSGTVAGNPLIGNFELSNEDPAAETLIYRNNEIDGTKNAVGFFPNSIMLSSSDTNSSINSSIDVSKENGIFALSYGAKMTLNETVASLVNFPSLNEGKGIFISNTIDEPLLIEHQAINPRGLSSSAYFGDNAEDNDYVQAKYVKSLVKNVIQESKPYQLYTALLIFEGSPALPNFVVFENTVGSITWERANTAEYIGTLNGGFPQQKVWAISQISRLDNGAPNSCIVGRIDDNRIHLNIFKQDGTPVEFSGEVGSIEIRVYN